MIELGYSLSSEEFSPTELINFSKQAEDTGFKFSLISDHFHPWTNQQPHSAFVWSVLGGISQKTQRMRVGTGVTCPIIRIHPAIIAQAAATSAVLMPRRFFLGVGTGENLNEHIVGERWPVAHERLEMLEEAIALIREMWTGCWQSHHGKYFTLENARIFTLPQQLPPIMVAASKPGAAAVAGRVGDGLISFEPDPNLVSTFRESGGHTKPRYGQLTVCYAESDEAAVRAVRDHWPNAAIGGDLMTDLPSPSHFEQAVELIQPEKITADMPLGPDPRKHIAGIKQFADAGFDHIYIHQVGPNQEDFFRFYSDTILPHFED
jgi:coenzyme F420-dependent glucose-6-phosphate dehydrogenase